MSKVKFTDSNGQDQVEEMVVLGGGTTADGSAAGLVVISPYIAPLETRTFIIDATADRDVLTTGAFTPAITDLIKMGGFPAAAKRIRVDLHFPALAVPFADTFMATVNAGTGTGDDAVAIARLKVVNFSINMADAGDTSQRCASASVPTIQWDMNIKASADIVENLYILPLFLGGGTGAGTVIGTVSIW